MFKDKYKRAMDNLSPSHDKIKKIKEMAADSKSHPKSRIHSRKIWYRIGAMAACAAMVFALYKPVSGYLSDGESTKDSSPKEANSYTEIYKLLRSSASNGNSKDLTYERGEIAAPAEDQATDESGRNSSDDYSGTNLQVVGVDESDIVKTDGKYIYAVADEYIYIISAENGQLELVSKVSRYVFENEALTSRAFEIYIRENRLIVLKEVAVEPQNVVSDGNAKESGAVSPGYDPTAPNPTGPDVGIPEYDYKYYYINGQTAIGVEIYDISDIENPKALNTIGQSGYIISSRMVGDMLYLVTNYYVYGDIQKSRPETYIPMTYANGEKELIEAADIMYNPVTKSCAYTVVSGIDTSGSGEMVSVKTVLGYGCTVYSNTQNLYLASPEYITEIQDGFNVGYNQTKIIKVALNNGNIAFAADGNVPGNILNQFAMDEYNGVFRIVTTVYKYRYQVTDNGVDKGVDGVASAEADTYIPADLPSDSVSAPTTDADASKSDGVSSNSGGSISRPDSNTSSSDPNNGTWNALYTLDADLNIIGKIENLAPGETVYSARFSGDIGYFVTFRQMDPLFAVDLSDPANPVIQSELKIPGFSEYLHPYGDGLLFGLGKNADIETGAVGCLKLAMFDVSNPTNVSEKHTLIVEDFYYTAASYNHKAILINPEKNIIAFQTDAYYLVYTYTAEKGFEELARIPLYDSSSGYYWDMSDSRGLYIGNFMYLITTDFISSYNLDNFAISDKIEFGK